MTVANRGEHLRPGEYADVTVQAQSRKSLAVPRTALLRTGTGTLVMRHAGDGRFVPTVVDVGLESPFWAEIKSGLSAGEEVAVNGQFLLAAEASIQDTLARMVSSR
jgi:Cu(I)/Ag(I) efflux system membrane fusion protein